MPALLRELGFEANERTRRARCLIHGGDNRTSLSWTEDGLWNCFACGRGGDKYNLVQEVCRCSFPEAVEVMAGLAGVTLTHSRKASRRLVQDRQQREQLERAAERYRRLERECRAAYRNRLRTLYQSESVASQRLAEMARWAAPDSQAEAETLLLALAHGCEEGRRVTAAYYLLAFGAEDERQRFTLYPPEREALIARAFEQGGVVDDGGRFVEIPL